MDDQSSQTTVYTSNSTIGPNSSSFTDPFTLLNYNRTSTAEDELDSNYANDDDGSDGAEYEEQLETHTTRPELRAVDNGENDNDSDNDNVEENEEEDEEYDDEEDDDPLHVRELALNYDYLLFKIQEHTQQLSQKIEANVSHSKQKYENEINSIENHLRKVMELSHDCDLLNLEIDKLEQLDLITKDFTNRLVEIDQRMKIHSRKFKR
ncbi:hypothetical protein CANARDRAFT_25990 [[Candida] arabinofermentans NRRL YB-2248]|uniref:Biogenesis of lysosome-related organelles complex 1 subunit CNL1 n=1 Tax=[Candida] arabinofermentans NRRL YB-2248 TaxID=983967 RepID=A0A1E4T7P5_9ASCO|nr:hypothetical protein CANARDRAFT_25990 [[Candida] arabinofermentans NRRL YB-2248]